MNQSGIAAARREVVPMKANAFHQLQQSNAQLQPLFPYTHPGAIIPCTAGFENDPSKTMGYFLHRNSVDEVALVIGSDGRLRTGDMWCGSREHGVGFDAPVPFFVMMVITQRQLEAGEQPEVVSFQCMECNNILLRYEFSAAEGEGDEPYPPLPTTLGSFEAADIMRKAPERLICDKCGHVNTAFPLPIWGWERYCDNTRIAQRAHASLVEAGA